MSIKTNGLKLGTWGRVVSSMLALVGAGAVAVGCNGDGGGSHFPITTSNNNNNNNNNNNPPPPPPPPPGTPTLTLTSPVESEIVPEDVPLRVTWTATNLSGTTVNLSFSTDDGATYTSIATNLPSTGSTTWTPPNGTTEARLRVEASTGSLRDDMTDDVVFRRVWFVNPTATGVADGLTWATGVARIQTALDELAAPGDQIWVANTGTQVAFNPGDAAVAIVTSSLAGVGIYGGFTGSETAVSQRAASFTRTTIDAEDLRNGVRIYSGGVAAVTTLDGFRVTRGAGAAGAGVLATFSRVALKDCTFDACAATFWGGGVAAINCDATVTDCTFSMNSAEMGGGGMFAHGTDLEVSGCTFSENAASSAFDNADGGGLSVRGNPFVSVTDCTFTKNTATRDGGGFYANDCRPTLEDCQFTENTAGRNGGGAAHIIGTATVVASTFTQNSADGVPQGGFPTGVVARLPFGAGGLYTENLGGGVIERSSFFANTSTNGAGLLARSGTMTLTNCVIADNTATGYGGGVFAAASSSVSLTFCTITRNAAVKGAGFGYTNTGGHSIRNSILYADVADEIAAYEADLAGVNVQFSDVLGGFPGFGNIDADPLFLNPATRDFKLAAGSPAIGVASPGPPVDRDNLARDANPDMGAYERR